MLSVLEGARLKCSGWRAPGIAENVYRQTGLEGYVRYLAENPDVPEMFHLSIDAKIPLYATVDLYDNWIVRVHDGASERSEASTVDVMVDITRAMARVPDVEVALRRLDVGNVVFPLLPPIAEASHAVLTSDAEVAEAYDDPDVFWHAWDTVEVIGARKLCIRGVDAIDDATWLAQTFEHTMAMARAARPKKTGYERLSLSPEEKRWWMYGSEGGRPGGEPVLAFVGYLPAEQLVEYSCFLAPGAHVHVQEIYTIRELLLRGENYGGQPIKTIRVVFAAKHMALSEKRPLLDVGARVYYVDGDEPDMVEVLE